MENLGKVSEDLQALDLKSVNSSNCLASISFEIPINEELAKKKRLPPKRILAAQKALEKNTDLTVENLERKQQQAEERRKRRKAEKLARIQERQEEAREMAKNVEILLQQQALQQGNAKNLEYTGVQKMSRQEIMKTAKHVAQNFNQLKQQTHNDLSVEDEIYVAKKRSLKENCLVDNHKNRPEQSKNDEREKKSVSKTKKNGGVAFTVEVDASSNINPPRSKKLPVRSPARKTVDHEQLLDKMRRAEERRMRRMELRKERVRANRDAYCQLSSKLEQLKQHQEISLKPDVDEAQLKAANKEAAKVATEIADTFDKLAERYKTDLERTEGFPCMRINLS